MRSATRPSSACAPRAPTEAPRRGFRSIRCSDARDQRCRRRDAQPPPSPDGDPAQCSLRSFKRTAAAAGEYRFRSAIHRRQRQAVPGGRPLLPNLRMPLPECRQRSSVSVSADACPTRPSSWSARKWLDSRRGRVLGASNSVAFEVGSLAASLLLGGTRTDLRVCTDAGRVGGRIVGLETEIADGHALRKQVRVDLDRCAERWLRRIDGRRRAGDSAQRLNGRDPSGGGGRRGCDRSLVRWAQRGDALDALLWVPGAA
jgi:hypothetical protein